MSAVSAMSSAASRLHRLASRRALDWTVPMSSSASASFSRVGRVRRASASDHTFSARSTASGSRFETGAPQKLHVDSCSKSIGAPHLEQRTVFSSTRTRVNSAGVSERTNCFSRRNRRTA